MAKTPTITTPVEVLPEIEVPNINNKPNITTPVEVAPVIETPPPVKPDPVINTSPVEIVNIDININPKETINNTGESSINKNKPTEEIKINKPQVATTPTVVNEEEKLSKEIAVKKFISSNLKKNVIDKDFYDLINIIKQNGTSFQIQLIGSLERYIENMKVGKIISPNVGVKYQTELWNQIKSIINVIPTEEFVDTWNLLLRFVNNYRSKEFNETHVYRFMNHQSNDEDIKCFCFIIHLVLTTSNPSTNSIKASKIDINKITSSIIIKPDGKIRLSAYYAQ